MQCEPQLPEEQFLEVVNGAADVGVLLITGMKDEASVAALSHLVPNSRLVEVYMQASGQTRRMRKGCCLANRVCASHKMRIPFESNGNALGYRPSLIFDNEERGTGAANTFFEDHLLRLVQPGGLALCTSLLQSHFDSDWTLLLLWPVARSAASSLHLHYLCGSTFL